MSMVYLFSLVDMFKIYDEEATYVYAEKIVIVSELFVHVLGPALVFRTDNTVYRIRACAIVPINT